MMRAQCKIAAEGIHKFFINNSSSRKPACVDFDTVADWLKMYLSKKVVLPVVVENFMRLLGRKLRGIVVSEDGRVVRVERVQFLGMAHAWSYNEYEQYRKSVYKPAAERMAIRKPGLCCDEKVRSADRS